MAVDDWLRQHAQTTGRGASAIEPTSNRINERMRPSVEFKRMDREGGGDDWVCGPFFCSMLLQSSCLVDHKSIERACGAGGWGGSLFLCVLSCSVCSDLSCLGMPDRCLQSNGSSFLAQLTLGRVVCYDVQPSPMSLFLFVAQSISLSLSKKMGPRRLVEGQEAR